MQAPSNADRSVLRTRLQTLLPLRLLLLLLSPFAAVQALSAASAPASTIVITDADPRYPCDETGLANALADAASGSIITFQCDSSRTILVLTSEKVVTKGLTIDGWNGGNRIRLSGNHLVRIFTISFTGFVYLSNLAFTDGSAGPYGGAIENYANLYLSNCLFTDNLAAQNGGAVNNHGYVSIAYSQFISNTAGELGGAFASGSNADIVGSQFENNSVTSGTGQGGAVLNYGWMTVSDSSFTGNRAANGAALYSANRFELRTSRITGNGSVESSVFAGGGVGNTGTMLIEQSTITANVSAQGGGVYNQGMLTIKTSLVSENSSTGYGAGIFNGATGDLTVLRSTIANNRVATGSGIANYGRLTINTSTISGNSGAGAAIYSNSPDVNISNSTIYSNTAPFGDSGNLHYSFGQTMLLANTIVAGGLPMNCNIPQTSNGYNLEDTNTCGFNTSSDLHGSATRLDPRLGPLQDNGGPTPAHALQPDSPAIDHGFLCLAIDQRGVLRPQGAACDIGAVEFERLNQSINFGSLPDRTLAQSPFTVSATVSSGLPITFTAGPDSICTVSGNVVMLAGLGTCTVTAHQTGNAVYNPAADVSQAFKVIARLFLPLVACGRGPVDIPSTLVITTRALSGALGAGYVDSQMMYWLHDYDSTATFQRI